MPSTQFPLSPTPVKLEEFVTKLQSVGAPPKVTTSYPASIGFGAANARGYPAILKFAGLLDSSGTPTDAYLKGLRGGQPGRKLVGAAISKAYKPLFDVYGNANSHNDADLITFVKSHDSELDNEKAGLVVKTFKALCKFGDFDGASADDGDDDSDDEGDSTAHRGSQRRRNNGNNSGTGVVINVNIALSVDATSDPAVYDAFFAAMAKHLKGLDGGA